MSDDVDFSAAYKELCDELHVAGHGLALTTIKALIDLRRRVHQAPIATSYSADFESNTWTFSIGEDTRVGAGRYAIVRVGNEE